MAKSPALISAIVPETPKGTIILCWIIGVSWTTPTMSPADTSSPTATVGSNVHFFSRSNASILTPRPKKLLWVTSWNVSNGRWIPSNISAIKPGANSTDNGPMPVVSSYTWIEATSPRISIISPITPKSPTWQMSWILASDMFSAKIKGPETLTIFPICTLILLCIIKYFVQLLFQHFFQSHLNRFRLYHYDLGLK